MLDCAKVGKEVLSSTGTGIIFCSFIQFKIWFDILNNLKLEVEKSPLIFIPPPGALYSRTKIPSLTDLSQIAIIFHKSSDYYISLKVNFLFKNLKL